MRSQEQRGADFKHAEDRSGKSVFATRHEAIRALASMRDLVKKLEGKISERCDHRRWPDGHTQHADAALQLFADLRVNEDTVDMLMCAAEAAKFSSLDSGLPVMHSLCSHVPVSPLSFGVCIMQLHATAYCMRGHNSRQLVVVACTRLPGNSKECSCMHAADIDCSTRSFVPSCRSAMQGLQQYSTAEATSSATARLPGTAAVLKALCTLFDRKESTGQSREGQSGEAAQQEALQAANGASAAAMSTADKRAAARARHRATLACYRVHFHTAAAERGVVAGQACMSFWCMSAGVVMRRLQAAGVRSLLLTSGTLSPLDATAEELSVPMQVRLENPHVVPKEQVGLIKLTCRSTNVTCMAFQLVAPASPS